MSPPIIASGSQPEQTGESLSPLAGLGMGAAAFTGTGFIPYKGGRVWDRYLSGIRSIETGFPSAILRTFRVSEFLSPFETWRQLKVPASQIQAGGKYSEYLKGIFGANIGGLSMSRQGALFGEVVSGGQKVGLGLQITAGTQRGTSIADYYARLTGTSLDTYESLNRSLLKAEYTASRAKIPYEEWLDEMEPSARRRKLILGAKFRSKISLFGKEFALGARGQQAVAKAEILTNLFRAKAASTAGRLNTLLAKPLDIPVIGPVVSKIPFIRSMAVAPGSTTQMMGRYAKKGLMLAGAWKGLEYYDYLRSQDSVWATALGTAGGAAAGALLFKGARRFSPTGLAVGAAAGLYTSLAPRFDEGLFHGAASVFTDANLVRAGISRGIGLTGSLQEQEAITPGLVSLSTALGFGGVGALGLGMGSYANYLRVARAEHKAVGGVAADILEKVRAARGGMLAEKLWESPIGRAIGKLPGGKHLTKIKSPMALGFIGGVAAWTALSSGLSLLSGNPLAAIPGVNLLGTTETPEELQRMYSGEEEVPIRKGRWWEFGRCIANSSMIPICYTGILKEAHEVIVGDVLIGRDGEEAKVLNVFSRRFLGEIIKFKTRASWITETKLTGNHKIPIWRNDEIIEIEAKELHINDKVEIPVPKLHETTTELISEDLIKVGLFLIHQDEILPAQTNWHSGNIQRSRGASVPRVVQLTPELGRLFGYFLAEGNLSFKDIMPYMIETVHAKSERWIVDDIISICEKEFNITPTVRFKKTGKKAKEGCWIVRICSSLLARIYFELFYNSDRQQDKLFPQIFMSTSKEFKEQLIEGYWRGDGHLDNNTYVISSCRQSLIESIFYILLNLGEYPYICKFEKNDFRGRHRIKWTPGHRSYFYKEHNSKLFCLVCSIKTEEYNDTVYDFEVDHPDHLFVAGTFLVHNSSKYAGGRIQYYRPHFLERLRTRAFQKGVYGDEAERWEHDLWLNPVKTLFGSDEWKYHYEMKHQYDRPAPVIAPLGGDIPFIGPLVAETFGKLLKPRKLVRPEEWILDGGEYAYRPGDKRLEPAYELGGLGPGAPAAPGEATQLFNELMYRRREAVGLVGFAEGAIQKAMTGREEVFQNLQTLAEMGKETGSEYWMWSHLNLGGALGASEPVRRFIPHERRYLEHYNPIRNSLPSWLPEDYFVDMKHGNIFDKIPEAEVRLPGPGYAALHPELRGVHPEEYPLIHRLKILSDVAMWSGEYRSTLSQARRQQHSMSDRDQSMLQTVMEQVKSKKVTREFQEYRFAPGRLEEQEVTVTEVLDPRRIRAAEFGNTVIELQGMGTIRNMQEAMSFARSNLEGRTITIKTPALESRKFDVAAGGPRMKAVAMLGNVDYGARLAEEELAEAQELTGEFERIRYSPMQQMAGRISEMALHGVETPLEYLTPISPASKLIRHRSAIEDYIATEAVGTGASFWDKPVENFLRPAAAMALKEIGFEGTPGSVRQRRGIEQYFDMLEWVKSEKLESQARLEGREDDVRKQQAMQQKTMFGVDVSGPSVNILRALPRRERDFFQAFSAAQTQEERAEIFGLVPENERRIYLSQWLRQEAVAARTKKDAGIATEIDDRVLAAEMVAKRSEGFGSTPELEEQWMQETGGQIPFDEWIREKKAAEYFATHSLPGADWLGWCVPPEQELMLPGGNAILASSISDNDKLLTMDGLKTVKNVFMRQTSETLIDLRVHHDSVHSMSATENHIILAIKAQKCPFNLRPSSICNQRSTGWRCNFCTSNYYIDYKPEWMPIKNVDTDTFLPIPLLRHSETDLVIDIGELECFPDNTLICDDILRPKSGRIKPINRRITIDEATSWLIGYYLAEGNVWAVGDRMRGVQFTAHIKEIPILELAQKIIKERFGLDSVIRTKHSDTGSSAYLVVASGLFGWLINYWAGRFCDKKFAPAWLEDITYKSQVALLEGLFTGDGAKDRRGTLILANKSLCEMAKRIYEAQGIPASIRHIKDYNGKPKYATTPLITSLNVIINENFIAYRVIDIKHKEYIGQVMDFEVEELHMYCSPIGIYHNSPSVDMEDIKMKYVQMQGLNIHDFDLWGERERMMARKPYINEELIAQMNGRATIDEIAKTRRNAKALTGMHNSPNARITTSRVAASLPEKYDIEIADGREVLRKETYKYMGIR